MENAEEIKLVDELINFQKIKEESESKIDEIKSRIINFSISNNINILNGTDKICSVKSYVKVIYPQDKTVFLELIKEKGLYNKFSSLNYLKLGPAIVRGEIDKEILELVRKDKAYRISLLPKIIRV